MGDVSSWLDRIISRFIAVPFPNVVCPCRSVLLSHNPLHYTSFFLSSTDGLLVWLVSLVLVERFIRFYAGFNLAFLLWPLWWVGWLIRCFRHHLGWYSRIWIWWWWFGVVLCGLVGAWSVPFRWFDLQPLQYWGGINRKHSRRHQSVRRIGSSYDSSFCIAPASSWSFCFPYFLIEPIGGWD